MTVEPAARVADEIAHGFGLGAMVAGALVGVAVGVAVVAATAATGGLAAVVIAGAVAGGGLAGGQIMSGVSTIFNLPDPTTGVLAIGSPNVFTNGRPAIRAELSSAAGCSGQPFNHPSWPSAILVREGSSTVMINGQPASRLKSKLMCGAHIKSASPNVLIGGATVQTGFVFDLEAWTKTGLEVLGLAALVGAGVFAAAAGVAAAGAFVGVGALGFAGLEGVGRIGDAIGPGYRDLLQGVVGMGLVVASPKIARKGQTAVQNHRRSVAQDFYKKQGWPQARIDSHLKGIDFSQPVKIVEIPADTSLSQWQAPGGPKGNYFAPASETPSTLGISTVGHDPSIGAVSKVRTDYVSNRPVQAMETRAASVLDDWSSPYAHAQTRGGGTQYFVPDPGAFKP